MKTEIVSVVYCAANCCKLVLACDFDTAIKIGDNLTSTLELDVLPFTNEEYDSLSAITLMRPDDTSLAQRELIRMLSVRCRDFLSVPQYYIAPTDDPTQFSVMERDTCVLQVQRTADDAFSITACGRTTLFPAPQEPVPFDHTKRFLLEVGLGEYDAETFLKYLALPAG